MTTSEQTPDAFQAQLRQFADLGATAERECTRCGARYEVFLRRAGEGSLCGECTDTDRREREFRERCAKATRGTLATIPERYQWATFGATELPSRVKDPSAIAAAKAALDAGRVVLLGPAGIGKTVLSSCILREWAERSGWRGVFVDAYQVSQARAQHPPGSGEARLVQDAVHAGALVLDDLGAEVDSPQSAIRDVLHARHANARPTIVTSGFSTPWLRSRYGDGIARRLFEGAAILEMKP